MTSDKITIIKEQFFFKKNRYKNKGGRGLWRKTWLQCRWERRAGDKDSKAGGYRLVSANGRRLFDKDRGLASLIQKSLPDSRAFCLEVHLSLTEKQQIILSLLMEAGMFLIPGVPALYRRDLRGTRGWASSRVSLWLQRGATPTFPKTWHFYSRLHFIGKEEDPFSRHQACLCLTQPHAF